VYILLRENPVHIARLCELLDLGQPGRSPSRVAGGFHHFVWRLETDGGLYAVKQLSPDTNLGDPATTLHYNTCESIAEQFSRVGVHAVHALKNAERYLQVLNNTGYLVYPWTDAVALDENCVSPPHALAVARLLSRMHGARINLPGLASTTPDVVQENSIIDMVNLATEHNLQSAAELQRRLPDFLRLCVSHANALETLANNQVVSHGDLDQKNVLWDEAGEPLLIDWECARLLNPTYELLLEALDWSGLASDFDHKLFERFLSEYRHSGGVIDEGAIEAALHCILGDWLDWLVYNIGRCVNTRSTEQHLLGARQIEIALSNISFLEQWMPAILSLSTVEPAEALN
jgi:hypothetical protein